MASLVNKIGIQRAAPHILLLRPASLTARSLSTPKRKRQKEGLFVLRSGVPMIMFCGLGVWVVSSGLEGKNKERDASQGRLSVSERQAMMSKEHDDLVERMNHVLEQDFDNTKRIERPDEILARRRREREDRYVWYKRWWRNIRGST